MPFQLNAPMVHQAAIKRVASPNECIHLANQVGTALVRASSFQDGGRLPQNDAPARARASIAGGLRWLSADFLPDAMSVGFLQEDGPHHEGERGHGHRIPQTRINIAGGLTHIDSN